MSTSARVSSKRFIRNQAFLDERNERKEPRRYNSGLPPLDSASSVSYPAAKRTAYNGRQWIGFGPIPQPPRLQLPRRFRRTKNASSDLIGRKKSPFCVCLRSCSELPARLLMASAPLPRQYKSSAEGPLTAMKIQLKRIQEIVSRPEARPAKHM